MNALHRFTPLFVLILFAGGVAFGQEQIPPDHDGLLNGDGLGMAQYAELNAYPGPKHAMSIKDELGLSKDQVTKIEDLSNGVEVSAKLKGGDIVAAEEDLNKMFASGTANEKAVRVKVMEIAKLRGELRFIHLQAHLKMKQILSANQLARYKELQQNEKK